MLDPKITGFPAMGWYEDGKYSGKFMTESQWKAHTRAAAAALDAARQNPANYLPATPENIAKYGSESATKGGTIIERVKSAGNAAKGSFTGGAIKAKVLPALSTLGKVSNAATAGWIGWKIGEGIRNLFNPERENVEIPPAEIAMVGLDFEKAPGSSVGSVCGTFGDCKSITMPQAAGAIAVLKKSGETMGTTGGTVVSETVDDGSSECNKGLLHGWEGFGGTTPIQPSGSTLIVSDYADQAPSTGCKTRLGLYFWPLHAANLGFKGEDFKGSPEKTTTVAPPVYADDVIKSAEDQYQDPDFDPWVGPASLPDAAQQPGFPGEEWLDTTVPGIEPEVKIRKYEEALREAGLFPEPVPLPESNTDPTRGPEGVTKTVPAPGTEVPTGTTVRVRYNPATAPEAVAPPVDGWTPPAVQAPNLDPLLEALSCDVFPFGIFCWLSDGFTSWNSGASCPELGVPVGTSAVEGSELPFDLCQFEPAMEIVRPVLVLLSLFTVVYVVAAAGLGFGGGGGDD